LSTIVVFNADVYVCMYNRYVRVLALVCFFFVRADGLCLEQRRTTTAKTCNTMVRISFWLLLIHY